MIKSPVSDFMKTTNFHSPTKFFSEKMSNNSPPVSQAYGVSPTNNSLIPIVTSPSIKSLNTRGRRADSVTEVNSYQLKKINDNLCKLAAYLEDEKDEEESKVSQFLGTQPIPSS